MVGDVLWRVFHRQRAKRELQEFAFAHCASFRLPLVLCVCRVSMFSIPETALLLPGRRGFFLV
jgi:hypothetical protein